jgi:hypothetical protein
MKDECGREQSIQGRNLNKQQATKAASNKQKPAYSFTENQRSIRSEQTCTACGDTK